MPVSESKVSAKKSIKKIKKGPSGSVKSLSPPVPTPSKVLEEVGEDEEEEGDYEGDEMEAEGMEGDEEQDWGEGETFTPGGDDEEEQEEEEEAEEEPKPPEHIFMCHEIVPRKSLDWSRKDNNNGHNQAKNSMDGSFDDGDMLLGPGNYGIRYRMLNPEDMQYRPAALAEINSKIAQFDGKRSHIVARLQVQANAQLSQYGCHRIVHHKGHHNNKLARGDEKPVKEGMDKLLNRLKIYKRVLSTLVIYFRAYAPLLFDIKKSYDDMLNFRIRQFKAAQYEKLRIYHDVSLVFTKMKEYQFPDYDKLLKGQQYLNLLMVRIHKQDEAILCLTEILRK